jgi:hypothetical protein
MNRGRVGEDRGSKKTDRCPPYRHREGNLDRGSGAETLFGGRENRNRGETGEDGACNGGNGDREDNIGDGDREQIRGNSSREDNGGDGDGGDNQGNRDRQQTVVEKITAETEMEETIEETEMENIADSCQNRCNTHQTDGKMILYIL